MNMVELARRVSERSEFGYVDTLRVTRVILKELAEAMGRQEEVCLKGWLTFKPEISRQRKYITPQGKEMMQPPRIRIRVYIGAHIRRACGWLTKHDKKMLKEQ